jgi:hypothetical protein
MSNHYASSRHPRDSLVGDVLQAHTLIDELLDAAVAAEAEDDPERCRSTLRLAFDLYRKRARAKRLGPCVPGLRKAARRILAAPLGNAETGDSIGAAEIALQLRIAMSLERDRLPRDAPLPQVAMAARVQSQQDDGDTTPLLIAVMKLLHSPPRRAATL